MAANMIVLLNCEPSSYGADRSSPHLLARANTHGDPTAMPILPPMHARGNLKTEGPRLRPSGHLTRQLKLELILYK